VAPQRGPKVAPNNLPGVDILIRSAKHSGYQAVPSVGPSMSGAVKNVLDGNGPVNTSRPNALLHPGQVRSHDVGQVLGMDVIGASGAVRPKCECRLSR
jgi:hypothetical protein